MIEIKNNIGYYYLDDKNTSNARAVRPAEIPGAKEVDQNGTISARSRSPPLQSSCALGTLRRPCAIVLQGLEMAY